MLRSALGTLVSMHHIYHHNPPSYIEQRPRLHGSFPTLTCSMLEVVAPDHQVCHTIRGRHLQLTSGQTICLPFASLCLWAFDEPTTAQNWPFATHGSYDEVASGHETCGTIFLALNSPNVVQGSTRKPCMHTFSMLLSCRFVQQCHPIGLVFQSPSWHHYQIRCGTNSSTCLFLW